MGGIRKRVWLQRPTALSTGLPHKEDPQIGEPSSELAVTETGLFWCATYLEPTSQKSSQQPDSWRVRTGCSMAQLPEARAEQVQLSASRKMGAHSPTCTSLPVPQQKDAGLSPSCFSRPMALCMEQPSLEAQPMSARYLSSTLTAQDLPF